MGGGCGAANGHSAAVPGVGSSLTPCSGPRYSGAASTNSASITASSSISFLG